MTSPNDFPWPQWVERLKQLYSEKLNGDKIAIVLATESGLAVSRSMVVSKLKRLGLHIVRPGPKAAPKPKLPHRPFNPFKNMTSKPPPLIPDQVEYILGKGIPLIDLTEDCCRWPLNTPSRTETYCFCGEECAALIDGQPADLPYCPCHCRMAYVPANGCRRKEYSRRAA